MKVQRLFTANLKDPYDGIKFVKRESVLYDKDGTMLSPVGKVEVPDNFSQTATDILAQKYLRRTGVPRETVPVPEEGVPEWLYRRIPMNSNTPTGGEESAKQVFHRMVGAWTYWGWKNGYFDEESDAKAFYDELCYMLARQMCAPNSPQWFNTGLHWAYGIQGVGQGHYHVADDGVSIVPSQNAYEHPQIHACFIQSIDDNLVNENGIMDLWLREARIFKYGSGTGTNFSRLRAKNEPLSGGGRSSGLMSFLKIGDAAAGSIKSGGTTRRAAKMVVLDADHPDIFDFVRWKVIEEQKVAALVSGSQNNYHHINSILNAIKSYPSDDGRFDPHKNKALLTAVSNALKNHVPKPLIEQYLFKARMGDYTLDLQVYNTDWEGEAYATVSGQNANNSVSLTVDFMKRLLEGGDFNLYWRTELEKARQDDRAPTPCRVIKAKELWDAIVQAAWQSADPGLQFRTTMNDWHTCAVDGEIEASNPCSEFMFLNDTGCNLASFNLMAFYDTETGIFDVDKFRHAVRLLTIVTDISVQMAQYPTRRIAETNYQYRTLGLGYANLGALLMTMGVPYDSDVGRNIAAGITAIMHGEAYRTSAEIAAALGTFPAYQRNRDVMLRVIRNHRRAAYNAPAEEYEQLSVTPVGIDPQHCPKYLLQAARSVMDEMLTMGERHGFRNAQVTAIAPTGTIGLLMNCDTTGIEPDFAHVKYKKLAGGGYVKIINQSIFIALKRLGYSDAEIEDIKKYMLGHGTLEGSPYINKDSLLSKGVPFEQVQAIEASCKNLFNIKYAFNAATLGEKYCRETLKLTDEQINSPTFNYLEAMGYTAQEIEAANAYVCGNMTIEGAPHIKDEHLPIFDCANITGVKGKRFIAPEGHIKMLASVQPFVSGSISKTINLPREATVSVVDQVYLDAWRLGLKCVSVYRDGSKLSQPLQASEGIAEIFSLASNYQKADAMAQAMAVRVAEPRRLPSRRFGYVQKAKIDGDTIFIRTGEYEDGSLGEIFIDMFREGTTVRSLLNCFAVAVSLGLQYGVPLSEYVNQFIYTKFSPSGIVSGHDHIKMASSIIDYIFRDLAITYLGRYDLAHNPPSEANQGMKLNGSYKINQAKPVIEDNNVESDALDRGYVCSTCDSSNLRRAGTCLVCYDCGTTTGCS
ncbi:MAG: adenosylcobalamin-dependent ribonucleoside-diphosphate reductase [Acidobacteria bacterium]|nr:MAG: adenosylcobalamin-dependent ribonucleoside-diphosphate reductase [Acidobacteriota bacterium]